MIVMNLTVTDVKMVRVLVGPLVHTVHSDVVGSVILLVFLNHSVIMKLITVHGFRKCRSIIERNSTILNYPYN